MRFPEKTELVTQAIGLKTWRLLVKWNAMTLFWRILRQCLWKSCIGWKERSFLRLLKVKHSSIFLHTIHNFFHQKKDAVLFCVDCVKNNAFCNVFVWKQLLAKWLVVSYKVVKKRGKEEKDNKYTKKGKTTCGLVSTKQNRHVLLLSKTVVMMKMIIISQLEPN